MGYLDKAVTKIIILGQCSTYYLKVVQTGYNDTWKREQKQSFCTMGSGHTQEYQGQFGLCLHRCWRRMINFMLMPDVG